MNLLSYQNSLYTQKNELRAYGYIPTLELLELF